MVLSHEDQPLKGDVRKSWLKWIALLVSYFWRSFSQFAADFIFFTDKNTFTVASAVKKMWKSVNKIKRVLRAQRKFHQIQTYNFPR